jgi:uncharacterized membrane protein
MVIASRTVVIDRPIGEVFLFFAEAENDPQWRTGVTEISRQGERGIGATYRQRVAGPGGRPIAADIEITAYEPDTHIAFRTIAGPVRPTGEYSFRTVAGGTEATLTLQAQLSGIKKLLMTKPVQKSIHAEVVSLDRAKGVLESRG